MLLRGGAPRTTILPEEKSRPADQLATFQRTPGSSIGPCSPRCKDLTTAPRWYKRPSYLSSSNTPPRPHLFKSRFIFLRGSAFRLASGTRAHPTVFECGDFEF